MMVEERRKISKSESIHNYALYLRETFELFDDNFDIESFVKDLGGQIRYFNSFKEKERLVKTGDESFDIYVDSQSLEHYRRFTIAHELGHLFVDFKYPGEKWKNIDIGEIAKCEGDDLISEEFATEFSCAFLMPKYRFKFIEEKAADTSYPTQAIAGHFNVPMSLVIWYRKKLEEQSE